MSTQLDDLTNEVAAVDASINNAVNLLGTIVAGGGDDPAKLVPLTSALATAKAALDAAVAKWTPGPASAPTPSPAPTPTPAPVPGPGVAAAAPKVAAHLVTAPTPTPSPKIR